MGVRLYDAIRERLRAAIVADIAGATGPGPWRLVIVSASGIPLGEFPLEPDGDSVRPAGEFRSSGTAAGAWIERGNIRIPVSLWMDGPIRAGASLVVRWGDHEDTVAILRAIRQGLASPEPDRPKTWRELPAML